jgi:hypothetical protein
METVRSNILLSSDIWLEGQRKTMRNLSLEANIRNSTYRKKHEALTLQPTCSVNYIITISLLFRHIHYITTPKMS